MSWVIVSKNSASNEFYPIDVLANTLPNFVKMDYQTAKGQPNTFWKDKKVIFHMTWAGEYLKSWDTFYRHIARSCPRFWIEFDADRHMNQVRNIDYSFRSHMCMYNKLYKYCKRFVWELPMAFNPFMGNPTKVPAGIYQKQRELPIQKKDIDFLGLIDDRAYNTAHTFRLLNGLKGEGYKVKCIVLDPKVYKWYTKADWDFDIIKNSKTIPGQQLYYGLLDRSKVLVDLSYRLTLGRVLYEALFHGALSVCPSTYGASHLLFPDLIIDPVIIDLVKVHGMCKRAIGKWSKTVIQKYRVRAADVAGIQRTIHLLQAGSK